MIALSRATSGSPPRSVFSGRWMLPLIDFSARSRGVRISMTSGGSGLAIRSAAV